MIRLSHKNLAFHHYGWLMNKERKDEAIALTFSILIVKQSFHGREASLYTNLCSNEEE